MGDSTRNILLLLLSVAAGCVDAIAFVNAGVFPANMTGNSVVLAVSLLHPGSGGVTLSIMALLGFCIGAASGAWIVHSADRAWSRRVSFALFTAGVSVVGCAITMSLSGAHFLPYIILAAAAAMGLQSAAVQQLGIAGVATVFVTGTLTTAIARFVGIARETADGERRTEKSPWLPAFSWFSYFGGAFMGGLQLALHTGLPVALPGLILLGVALVSWAKIRHGACKPGR